MRQARLAMGLALALSSTFVLSQEEPSPLRVDNSERIIEKVAESVGVDKKTYREQIKNNLEAKGEIKGIQELPITKLFFVEAQQGTYIISSDGRFVFDGKLKDVWHRRTISTLADARETERVPVSNIGFAPEEQLATFQFGNPDKPRSGVAFVDPTSAYTAQFLQIIHNHKEMNWTVVLLPLVGGNSAVDRSVRLWCSTDREGAKQDLMTGGSEHLGVFQEGCNDERIVMGMMLSDVFRIRSLPHLIREDGLTSAGLPKDFNSWFKQP